MLAVSPAIAFVARGVAADYKAIRYISELLTIHSPWMRREIRH